MGVAELLTLIALLALALYGIDAHRREKRRQFILRESMPQDLQEGRLIASEHFITTDAPRKMHGALDQLYRLKTDQCVLSDTKTRPQPRVYRKDIVQLSVYRVILQRKGYQMADYGYVRLVTPEGVTYKKANLLSEAETVQEYDRTKQVLNREVSPTIADHKGMCASCAQQINCDEWQFVSGS